MAKKTKNIDQIINDSFSVEEEAFDFSTWNNIEDKLGSTDVIDDVVSNAFEVKPETLPDAAWEGVNDALDIETVWERLDENLRKKRLPYWYWLSAAVLIIGFVGAQMFYNTAPEITKVNELSERDFNSSADIMEKLILNSEDQLSLDKSEKRLDDETKKDLLESSDELLSDRIIEESNGSMAVKIERFTAGKRRLIHVDNLDRVQLDYFSNFIFNPMKVGNQDELTLEESIDRKWSVGTIMAVNNTIVYDANSREGRRSNSLIYNDLVVVSSAGLLFQYALNTRYSISSELFISSIQKSRNNLYMRGRLMKKETNLEYLKTSLLITKNIKLKNLNNCLSFSGGGYLSYLKRSSIKYNEVITQINSDYKILDSGLKAEISSKHLFQRFEVIYGVHSEFGLVNVFEGNSRLPSVFNVTRNISSGFHLKIAYSL